MLSISATSRGHSGVGRGGPWWVWPLSSPWSSSHQSLGWRSSIRRDGEMPAVTENMSHSVVRSALDRAWGHPRITAPPCAGVLPPIMPTSSIPARKFSLRRSRRLLGGRRADIRLFWRRRGAAERAGAATTKPYAFAAGDAAALSERNCVCTAGVRIRDGLNLPSRQPLTHQRDTSHHSSRIPCG
jgi:hypothetical protein